ncbi:aspartyl-phosphate phosphatase Spo0E family protein [Niallia sp. XMNu-256]|uniref:aspartyl-phosphate phosphatase Spo0E family protein n=1 Tax=Niallia sp. XMNu-256 TaxID=3082444 RepID=UPI0030CB8901
MSAEIEKLQKKIHCMRKNLILIAKDSGLNSDNTLYYSQKLDELIIKYQKLKLKNREPV